jgi:hypothetical protein
MGVAIRSVATFARLVLRRRLRMPRERLGVLVGLAGSTTFRVFRETCLDSERPLSDPAVLEVGFRLKAIGSSRLAHRAFQKMCLLTTPFWAGVPGFSVKLWLVDGASDDYGGLYQWRDAEAAERYAAALLPVLRVFSVAGSVWYRVTPHLSLETRLAAPAKAA